MCFQTEFADFITGADHYSGVLTRAAEKLHR